MANLTLKNWELGIGESPYTGFAQMTNVDIYSKPGCLKISNRLEVDSDSGDVVTELMKWGVQDPENNDIYTVDRDGKLYKRDRGTSSWSVITGHGTSAANGEGLAIWKDYLFYARRSKLDVYGPLSGSPSWVNDWQDLESSFAYNLHPMLQSAELSTLIIGNAQYLDTLIQVPGQTFDPNDAPGISWIYNSQDMELGSEYRVTCLEQQASSIAIGTLIGINNAFNVADIFFWDVLTAFSTTGSTVRLVDNGVKMMKNSNNVLYVIAGNGVPRLFTVITAQSNELKRFNNFEVEFTSPGLVLFPGGTDLLNGEVMFGLGASQPSVSPDGVYSIRNNAYVLRYVPSTGNTVEVVIGMVKVIDDNRILVAWKDDNNTPEFGVDILTENYYTGYTAFAESPLYTVGTEDDPTTYEKVQVTMGKNLADGDGIKIKARYSLDGTWVTIATFDTTVTPAYIGRNTFDIKVSNLGHFKEIQFRVELNTDEDSESSPELKQIDFT